MGSTPIRFVYNVPFRFGQKKSVQLHFFYDYERTNTG